MTLSRAMLYQSKALVLSAMEMFIQMNTDAITPRVRSRSSKDYATDFTVLMETTGLVRAEFGLKDPGSSILMGLRALTHWEYPTRLFQRLKGPLKTRGRIISSWTKLASYRRISLQ